MWTIRVDGWHYTTVDSEEDLFRVLSQIHKQQKDFKKKKYDVKYEFLES